MKNTKPLAQFWVAIIGTGGMVTVAIIVVAVDAIRGTETKLASMLAGGLLLFGGHVMSWLYPKDSGGSEKAIAPEVFQVAQAVMAVMTKRKFEQPSSEEHETLQEKHT